MYTRNPWELEVDPLGYVEHTLGTTGQEHEQRRYINILTRKQDQ
jgi:hypothetical protein